MDIVVQTQTNTVNFVVQDGQAAPSFAGISLEVKGPMGVVPKLISSAPWSMPVDPAWPAGDYTVQAVAVDSNGNSLGSFVTTSFTIGSVEVTYPLSINLEASA